MFTLKRLTTGLVIAIEGLVLFLYQRLDPDSFHSGLVYAQGIAVSNGLLPNKNFLSPYGVVGPLVNGAWLYLIDDTLLSLNLLYGLLIVCSGYLVQRNAVRYLDYKLAILLNLTWVMTLASVIPWPSILANFLILVSFTILIDHKDKAFYKEESFHIYLVPVAVLLQLSVLTRIHLAITLVLISAFIIVFQKYVNKSFVVCWFVYNLFIFLLFILLMLRSGVFQDWFYQVVVWPATEFDSPPITLSYIFSLMWFPLGLIYCFFILRVNLFAIADRSIKRLLLITISNIALFYLVYFISTRNYDVTKTSTFKTLPGFLKNSSENLQFFLGFSAAMIVLFGAIHSLLRIRWPKSKAFLETRSWEKFLLIGLGLTGIVQLYPLNDNVHIWFVTPLLLIPAAYFSKSVLMKSRSSSISFSLMLVGFLVVQSVSAYDIFKIDRVNLVSYEQRGLLGSKYYFSSVDQTIVLLAKHVKGRELRNNCIQGIFAVSGGKYNSIDGNFSSNSYEKFAQTIPTVDPSEKESKYILECNLTYDGLLRASETNSQVVFKLNLNSSSDPVLSTYNVLFMRK